ncbi:ribonuclease H, partial [Trifolium pratense]
DRTDLGTKEPEITQQNQNDSGKNDETVLSPTALLKAQDNQLEEELNDNLRIENDKELNATASLNSFVDDTQNQLINVSVSSASDESRQTPERVLKDMAFLKESWNNMAETEEETHQVLEETDKNLDNNDDGDFNVILGAHEHRGRISPARLPMDEFQAWTDSFQLFHLPTRGAEFTWNNGRGGSRHTEKRLDRAVCNQAWLDLGCVSVTTLTKHKSDHSPLLLEYQLTTTSFASHFKFMRMWSLHPDCRNIILNCWNTVIVGCPMFILSQKLKLLKNKLKIWNKQSFGNVHDFVISTEQKLQHIQDQIQQNGHTVALLAEEKLASNAYEEALNRQEIFWQEKAKLNWHLEGDRNTKYFHRLAKIKTSTKAITSLQDGEHDSLLAEDVIPKLVTNEVNAVLTMLPSHDEVRAAVFALNKDSAPGPDGFGAFFYQHYWDIVKKDVISAVLEFFTSSWILPGFNSNIIALLPKTPNASSIDQYRPIAMANFKFKVISKIIADRLASILPSIVSEEQKGFIHERNIKDCLCIASEATNLLHNKSYGGNLALKIDITKAFDTLDWRFLLKVLKTFGFNEVFCNWILVILQSAYLSVSINGKSHGFFNCSRGVRQGDPLSPLLFCLAEDVLSRSITKLVSQGNLNLIKGTRNFKIPSHSFYADDLLVFCKGNLSGLKTLKDLFDKGKPKTCHLQPVADKIKLKLSAWKAALLSIAGRVQLVRNFIWSGDIDKRKLVTTSWQKICRPYSQEQLHIPDHIRQSLSSTVSDYIFNGHWTFPPQLVQAFPNLNSIISQVTIPMEPSQDRLLWKHTDTGDLQLKEAYHFKMQQFQDLNWAKYIWSCDIPP